MKKIEPFMLVCKFDFVIEREFAQQVLDALPTGIFDKLELAPRYDKKMSFTYSHSIMLDKNKKEISGSFLFMRERMVRNDFFRRLSHVKKAMSDVTQKIEVKYSRSNIAVSNKKTKVTKNSR